MNESMNKTLCEFLFCSSIEFCKKFYGNKWRIGVGMDKRAQSSLEMVFMIGFMLLFLVPVIFIVYQKLSEREDDVYQMKTSMDRIANAVEKVYVLGCPNKIKLSFFTPALKDVSINEKEFTFKTENREMVRNFITETYGNFNCSVAGGCSVYVSSFGDFVLLSKDEMNASCSLMKTFCPLKSCADAQIYIHPHVYQSDWLSFQNGNTAKLTMEITNNCSVDITILPGLVTIASGSADATQISAPASMVVPADSKRKLTWTYTTSGTGAFSFRFNGVVQDGGAQGFGPCETISAKVYS